MAKEFKRIILKISGEALSSKTANLDFEVISKVSEQIKMIVDKGIEVCLVVGGGNIWRGREGVGMDRTTADHMGMLATVINALSFQDSLERIGIPVRVQTAIEMRQIAEPYIRRRAVRHLEKNRVVIFACGTGNPYFSTDMAAALRAAEMEADMIMLAKNIDGVYDSDPKKNPDAKRFESISYMEVLNRGLMVMDQTAVTLCMENQIPICVFGLSVENGIERVLNGEKLGTMIE